MRAQLDLRDGGYRLTSVQSIQNLRGVRHIRLLEHHSLEPIYSQLHFQYSAGAGVIDLWRGWDFSSLYEIHAVVVFF